VKINRRSGLGQIDFANRDSVSGTVPAGLAVFHWGFCHKPGVKIPLPRKMAVYTRLNSCRAYTAIFLVANSVPVRYVNPPQALSAFTILWW
jgi:hypothetical protein